jgi:hypothetical protein
VDESAPVIDYMAPILIVAGALAAGVEAANVDVCAVVAVDVVFAQLVITRLEIISTPRIIPKSFFTRFLH